MFVSPSSGWPDVAFHSVPRLAAAETLAAMAREAAGTPVNCPQDLNALLTIGRFDLRLRSLGACGGGIEAALAPRDNDRFEVVVDTEPRNGWASVAAGLREQLARHRLRFRVAHEIGHSFFYDRAHQRPRRLVFDSPELERWCDRFASALLLPPPVVAAMQVTPQALLDLQRDFDVSLQVAARACARIHRERFIALLIARGPRPPHIRVQWQKRNTAPTSRWWTAAELQSALSCGRQSGTVCLPWPDRCRAAVWRALPSRGQLLVVA
jgi:hypothetical protein